MTIEEMNTATRIRNHALDENTNKMLSHLGFFQAYGTTHKIPPLIYGLVPSTYGESLDLSDMAQNATSTVLFITFPSIPVHIPSVSSCPHNSFCGGGGQKLTFKFIALVTK
jgi:hypothetical protein